MLNWDALIPASTQQGFENAGHRDTAKTAPEKLENTPESGTHTGHDIQGNAEDLPNKCAFVPACPGENGYLSRLPVHAKSLSNNDNIAFVPVVPVVPAVLQGVSSSIPENGARGGGGGREKKAPENAISRFLSETHIHGYSYDYPLNPAAVCLVVAACEQARKSPEEIGQHVHSLHRLAPAEQVRHWHANCQAVGVEPWRVLTMASPGEGKDCGMCAHLDSVLHQSEGDGRRCFRWACKLGYLILEYGRATERIMLAPPECDKWERHYPGPWR